MYYKYYIFINFSLYYQYQNIVITNVLTDRPYAAVK